MATFHVFPVKASTRIELSRDGNRLMLECLDDDIVSHRCEFVKRDGKYRPVDAQSADDLLNWLGASEESSIQALQRIIQVQAELDFALLRRPV